MCLRFNRGSTIADYMAPRRLKLCGSNYCFEDGIETLIKSYSTWTCLYRFCNCTYCILFGRGAGILNEAMLRWFFQVCNRQPSWNAQKEWSMWYWTRWIILRYSKSVFPYSGILSQTIPLRIQYSRKYNKPIFTWKRNSSSKFWVSR